MSLWDGFAVIGIIAVGGIVIGATLAVAAEVYDQYKWRG